MRIKSGFLVPALLILVSCTEPSQIGANFFNEGDLTIVSTDTLTLDVSTVTADSVVTLSSPRLLVGYHNDLELGKIRAAAYFRAEPRSLNNDGESLSYTLSKESTEYLGTSLVLWYDGYSYYDTADYQTLFVHQLFEEIETEDDGSLYNTSSTKYWASPLGKLVFKPKPISGESIEIPWVNSEDDDAFDPGRAIYEEAISDDNDLAVVATFVDDFLKGIVLLPDTTVSGSILGFDTNAEIRVHYLDKSVVPSEEKYLTFFVSGLRYNEIKADRRSNPLGVLTDSRQFLSSNLTSQLSYIQGGAGLYMRVEIPYLRSILVDNPDLILTQALLTFYPKHNSHRINTGFPERLKVYAVNQRNEVTADFLSTNAVEGFVFITLDTDLNRDTYYQVNVLPFIQSQLALEENNDNALLFSLDEESRSLTVGRLILGNQNSESEMKLRLSFAVVR